MSLKQFTINFRELGKISNLFLTTRIKEYQQKHRSDYLPFSYYIDDKNIYTLGQIKREDYRSEGEFPIIDQGQNFIAGYSDDNDLVYTGKLPTVIFGDHTRVFKYVNFPFIQGADGIKVIKPNENIVNPKFFYYLLSKIGVTSRGYNRHFSILKKQKYPLISKSTQDKIITQIEPIEKKIKELKNKIISPQEIINKVFAREFKFDLEKFEKLKKRKFFVINFSGFNTALIRSTVVQNSLNSNLLKSFLRQNTIFLKDIILQPIRRGKQPEYKENGIKVIKTLNIQNGKIDFEETQFVSEKFLKDNEQKASIYQNDLLLTSTGMGRGKFALYEDPETVFADSHISIIRFNQDKILSYFLNYYCQSFFGFEQLKYIEMQIKGTPEIYETQLKYFQIPDISIKAQQKIVNEIKAELDKQEEINQKIKAERNKIEEIIQKAIE